MNRKALTIVTIGLVALLTAISAGVTAQAANGDAYDPEAIANLNPASQVGIVIDDNKGSDFTGVGITNETIRSSPTGEAMYWCTSFDDPKCAVTTDGNDVVAQSVLPFCSSDTYKFCVESLDMAAPNGDFQPAKFVREANGENFPSLAKYNYPAGQTPSLFTADNAPTAGGLNTYAARVTLSMKMNTSTHLFEVSSFKAALMPYRYVADSNIIGLQGRGSDGLACAFIEAGGCGVLQDWVPGTKAKLTFRAPSSIGGWFKGRLLDPQIDIKALDSSVNEISVQAMPVSVPQLSFAKNYADINDVEKTAGWWGCPTGKFIGLPSWSTDIAKFIDLNRTILNDTATGVATSWNFSTMDNGSGSPCLQDTSRVLGIVTTNAMGYDGSSPAFANGYLDYHVSGLHFAPNGTDLNEGTYDMVMRSDTARCLYGFTNAPISATVSVIAANGDTKTAVTTVTENDGWLKLAAYGFTFSNPTVQVHMTQAAAVVASTPTTTKTTTKASTKTITCVKGKLTKKITAAAPKCPAGYKKK